MELIQIHNEDGSINDGLFEVIKHSTGTKNVIQIRNVEDGKERLICKDRIFLTEKRRSDMEKTPVSKETKKAKKKKKKPLEKFDLKQLESVGILYQKGNATDDMAKMEVEDQVFVIKSFWVVSPDATKWKHFNLYNDSLGRKGKVPEFDDSDVVKAELSGDLEAIEKYLSKKGYDKV